MAARDRTLVMKFGGTSVGTPEAIHHVVEIVERSRKEWPRQVVVASAMSGVTNQLLESSRGAISGDLPSCRLALEAIREKHLHALHALVPAGKLRDETQAEIEKIILEFKNLCQAITVLGEATPRALDAIASLGERLSVRLLSAVLRYRGIENEAIEATALIRTDDCYQNAHPDFDATRELTRQVLLPILDQGVVPVVTGFLAADPGGVTTTLGRGGSDFSAAILAAVLPAQEVWIWTDVNGILTADPRLVSDAHTIELLSYHEVAELAYFGAKVLHPKTIRPVIEAGIDLRILNTFNPGHPGTRVVPNSTSPQDGSIKAVTAIQGQRLINIEGRGMLGVPGVAARAFGAVAETGTSVILITQASSEQSICFAVPTDAIDDVVSALEKAFAEELAQRDIDRISSTGETVIVTVVGAGMRHTPGVAGRVFSILGNYRVNVIAIAQGSSEAAISMVVDAAEAELAVRAIHSLIINAA